MRELVMMTEIGCWPNTRPCNEMLSSQHVFDKPDTDTTDRTPRKSTQQSILVSSNGASHVAVLRVRLVAVLAGSRSAGPAPAADLRPVSPVDSHSGTVLPAPMPKGGMEQAPCIAFGQVGEHVPRRRRPAIGTRD